MKISGIVRKLDPLGRIVIPKEMRKLLSIEVGDPIEIIKYKNNVVLKKYRCGCIFCGSLIDIIEFQGSYICKECRKKLR